MVTKVATSVSSKLAVSFYRRVSCTEMKFGQNTIWRCFSQKLVSPFVVFIKNMTFHFGSQGEYLATSKKK